MEIHALFQTNDKLLFSIANCGYKQLIRTYLIIYDCYCILHDLNKNKSMIQSRADVDYEPFIL